MQLFRGTYPEEYELAVAKDEYRLLLLLLLLEVPPGEVGR
jgi:hypothetical protein